MGVIKNGKEIEIEKSPKTPVQIDEKRTAGRTLDVAVPVAQARWVAFALTALVAASLWLIVAWGQAVFAVATFIIGMTTFIWFLWQANKWEHGITIIELGNGVLLTLFCGGVAWSLWKISTYLVPVLALPSWLSWWPLLSRWSSLMMVVFSLSLFLHLELAFVQELAQRSPFQEKAIWNALGAGLDRWLKRPRDDYRPPVIVHSGNGGNSKSRPPLSEVIAEAEADPEPSAETMQAADLAEFIILGRKRGFERRKWREGVKLSSGTIVGETRARRWAAQLRAAGLLETQDNKTVLVLSLRETLGQIGVSSSG